MRPTFSGRRMILALGSLSLPSKFSLWSIFSFVETKTLFFNLKKQSHNWTVALEGRKWFSVLKNDSINETKQNKSSKNKFTHTPERKKMCFFVAAKAFWVLLIPGGFPLKNRVSVCSSLLLLLLHYSFCCHSTSSTKIIIKGIWTKGNTRSNYPSLSTRTFAGR